MQISNKLKKLFEKYEIEISVELLTQFDSNDYIARDYTKSHNYTIFFQKKNDKCFLIPYANNGEEIDIDQIFYDLILKWEEKSKSFLYHIGMEYALIKEDYDTFSKTLKITDDYSIFSRAMINEMKEMYNDK